MKTFILNILLWIAAALIALSHSFEDINNPDASGLNFFGWFVLIWGILWLVAIHDKKQ